MTPTNRHAEAIYHVFTKYGFSLKDVINDSMFFKFQTRLSEIEAKHGIITTKKRITFTNKFGRKSSYMNYYKCVSNDKLIELFKLYNDE